MEFDHKTYISPFSWRYGSDEMRRIWSEYHKRQLMRQIWVALARVHNEAGMVSAAQLADLIDHQNDVDIERAVELEKQTRHDVMAEIRTYAEQCPVGGGIIHWGATSADITDNVDILRIREAGRLIKRRLGELLLSLADKIEGTAYLPIMAMTHIQPAEPSTLGYRFAVYAQDLYEDWRRLAIGLDKLRGKGLKGAVGTQASFQEILRDTDMDAGEMEKRVMAILDLPFYSITTQTYPRQQDLHLLQSLAGVASSLHKFALDFRILQSPALGEWSEPFGKTQVGSSAMPFKRNPINTENICSLARYVASLPAVAWDNASQAILERSLDDSANRRLIIAEGFLASDELLTRSIKIVSDMNINEGAISKNLALFGPFSATERVLMQLVAKGADRQEGHERLRNLSIQAWRMMEENGENPLTSLVSADEYILYYLTEEQILELMNAKSHTGSAAERALEFAKEIRMGIAEEPVIS